MDADGIEFARCVKEQMESELRQILRSSRLLFKTIPFMYP